MKKIRYNLLWLILALALQLQAQDWVLQNTGSTGDIFKARFYDKDNGIAAAWIQPGSAEILRTSNGGSSWSNPLSDINKGMTCVTLLPPSKAIAVGGTNNAGIIYVSQNKGASWNMVEEANNAKPSFWTVDFADDKVGYAGGGNGVVYKTTNGGSSWAQTVGTTGTGAVIDIDFVSPTVGYAVVATQPSVSLIGSYLYKTTDGGNSWTKSSYQFVILCGINFTDAMNGYAVGHSGAGPTVWHTTNGGETWERKTIGSSLIVYMTDITFTPENPYVGYAVGGDIYNKKDGIIARTTDGGANWTIEKSNLPKLLLSIDFPTETTGYAAGYGGSVYKTTRTPIPPPQPTISTTYDTLEISPVAVGDSTTDYFEIRPEGAANLRIDAIDFEKPTDATAQGWSMEIEETLPFTLGSGGRLPVAVSIKPNGAPGTIEQWIVISSNDKKTPKKRVLVKITITAAAAPKGILSTNSIDFGTVQIGKNSTRNLKVYSKGTADLVIETIKVLDNAAGFTLLSTPALPLSIAPGDSVELSIRFTPKVALQSQTKLLLKTNNQEKDTLSTILSGQGEVAASAEEMENNAGYVLYPNPGSKSVRLRCTNEQGVHTVRIYDNMGCVVGECTEPDHTNSIVLNTEHLSNGTYRCVVYDQHQQPHTLPLIIVR